MSSASGPPYPPGPYPSGRQAPPAALPGRRARALPAGSSPAEMEGDGAGDAATPQGPVSQAGQAGQNGPVGQPGGYQGMTMGGYPGGNPGYGGQQPGWPGGPAGFDQAPGGGLPAQQPGGYAGQQFSAGYPGQPPAGFAGRPLPGTQ